MQPRNNSPTHRRFRNSDAGPNVTDVGQKIRAPEKEGLSPTRSGKAALEGLLPVAEQPKLPDGESELDVKRTLLPFAQGRFSALSPCNGIVTLSRLL